MDRYKSTARARYSTKAIQYDEDGPGLYTILITRLELPEGHMMTRKGFRSGHFLYTVVESGPHETYHDLHKVANRLTADDDSYLFRLLAAIEKGAWSNIDDGEVFTPEKIDNSSWNQDG